MMSAVLRLPFFVVCCLGALCCVSTTGPLTAELYCPPNSLKSCPVELAMTAQVNRYRRQLGLPPFQHSNLASFAARDRTHQQLLKGDISHKGFPDQRRQLLEARGMPGITFLAENVAMFELADGSPAEVSRLFLHYWLQSQKHRQNIAGNYRYYGASVDRQGDLWVATAFFY